MSNPIYDCGYEAGRYSATLHVVAIKRCPNNGERSAMAGRRLEEHKKNSKDFTVRSIDSWARGFWDGFMDKADEIVAEKKK